MDKVSVIIPVYNDEKYIATCIESATHQTYKNIEIIIVNDGSTDNSPNICENFTRTDSRITIIHKKNGGLSSARNAGLKIAKGEYITFLDSDDYLSQDFIKTALNACIETKSDIAVLKMMFVNEEDTQQHFDGDTDEKTIITPQEAIEESLYQKKFSCCSPGKLYKKEIFRNTEFPIGKLSEDLATCHLFFDNAEKAVYIDTTGYYYRQRPKSIMHTFNPARLDALKWTKEIEAFCQNKYPDIIQAAFCRTFNVATHLILDMDSNEYFDEVWKELVRTRAYVLKNKKTRGREKVAAILSLMGPKVLNKAWNSRYAIRKDK